MEEKGFLMVGCKVLDFIPHKAQEIRRVPLQIHKGILPIDLLHMKAQAAV